MNLSRICLRGWFVAVVCSQGQCVIPANGQTPSMTDLDKVVNDAVALKNYSDAKKPALVASYLQHDVLTIRLKALYSLSALGLPEDLGNKYEVAEMSWDAVKVAAAAAPIKEWAEKTPSSPDPVTEKHTRDSILRSVINSWLDVIREWNRADEYACLFGRSFPGLVSKLRNDAEREEAFTWGMRFVDRDDLLSEIGMPTDPDLGFEKKEEVNQWLPQVGQWMASNHTYFYFHRKERRLKLDSAARSAGVPSKDYRVAHPWGPNEGPNVTDPNKKWTRIFRDED